MRGSVSLGDGVRIDTGIGTVVADGKRPDGDLAVCSHAHSDHLPSTRSAAHLTTVCSELTAALAGVRRSSELSVDEHPDVSLLPAGHVVGSRAVLVDDGNVRYCYTGDVCTRDRCHLDGFEPPDADVLVVEATYGKPGYVFPDHDEIERQIFSWLDETMDRPVVCVGYALGRAQKLQHVIERSDRTRCLVSEGVAAINEPIEAAGEASFDVEVFDGAGADADADADADGNADADTDADANADADAENDGRPALEPGDALVVPASVARSDRIQHLVEETDALTAGFSGWAAGNSFRYRTGYHEAFPLSDHCDYEELLDLVEAVDPDAVYTQHGFADEFAEALVDRGFRARSLRRNQATLSDF